MIDSRVVSVNVGTPREFDLDGKRHTSAIWKEPVEGRLAVRGVNIEGDDQADRKSHGGPDQAIYAYALEDYDWWSTELGRSIAPGTFGDNLTLAGMEVNQALVGERWRVGNTVLEVAHPGRPATSSPIAWATAPSLGDSPPPRAGAPTCASWKRATWRRATPSSF